MTSERHSSSAVDLTNTNSCQLNSTHVTPTNCSRITSTGLHPSLLALTGWNHALDQCQNLNKESWQANHIWVLNGSMQRLDLVANCQSICLDENIVRP